MWPSAAGVGVGAMGGRDGRARWAMGGGGDKVEWWVGGSRKGEVG